MRKKIGSLYVSDGIYNDFFYLFFSYILHFQDRCEVQGWAILIL